MASSTPVTQAVDVLASLRRWAAVEHDELLKENDYAAAKVPGDGSTELRLPASG